MMCRTINRESNPSRVWNIIKKFNNRKFMMMICSSPHIAQQIIQNLRYLDILPEFNYVRSNKQSHLFTIIELQNSLNDRKDTVTGKDNISYSMLQNLSMNGKNILLQMLIRREIPTRVGKNTSYWGF